MIGSVEVANYRTRLNAQYFSWRRFDVARNSWCGLIGLIDGGTLGAQGTGHFLHNTPYRSKKRLHPWAQGELDRLLPQLISNYSVAKANGNSSCSRVGGQE